MGLAWRTREPVWALLGTLARSLSTVKLKVLFSYAQKSEKIAGKSTYWLLTLDVCLRGKGGGSGRGETDFPSLFDTTILIFHSFAREITRHALTLLYIDN